MFLFTCPKQCETQGSYDMLLRSICTSACALRLYGSWALLNLQNKKVKSWRPLLLHFSPCILGNVQGLSSTEVDQEKNSGTLE